MTTPRGWRSSCALSAPTSPVTIPTCCSFVRVGEEQAPALGKFMQAQGVLINASPVVRLVTHRMSTVSS